MPVDILCSIYTLHGDMEKELITGIELLAETFLCLLIANFERAARQKFPSVVHLTRH
jgi:hypothetical protein